MPSPRRALGHLLGNGVRFGVAHDVLAAGEGVETVLALRAVLPALPMVAALSAGHLAAHCLPPTLRRLYVARDNDAAGRRAAERLGSLYVRLHGTAPGRWADPAAGEHGDLLDLIGLNRGLGRLAEVLDEARAFLSLPRAPPEPRWEPSALIGSPEAARRLFARSRPLAGTLAEAYLRNRGIPDARKYGSPI